MSVSPISMVFPGASGERRAERSVARRHRLNGRIDTQPYLVIAGGRNIPRLRIRRYFQQGNGVTVHCVGNNHIVAGRRPVPSPSVCAVNTMCAGAPLGP